MKVWNWVVVLLSVCCYFSALSYAGSVYIKDGTNAKLARIKAKQRGRQAQSQNSQPGSENPTDKGGCGSIDIGNVTNERGSRGTREITVIITGDVINANNNCK